MTVLSTRWRFDDYTKKGEFYVEKNNEKIRESLFTYKLQNAELLSFWWDFSQKNNDENSRESLFTFKLHTTELLSFWRDFAQKIQNPIWRHLAVILGTIGTKADLPL